MACCLHLEPGKADVWCSGIVLCLWKVTSKQTCDLYLPVLNAGPKSGLPVEPRGSRDSHMASQRDSAPYPPAEPDGAEDPADVRIPLLHAKSQVIQYSV